MQHNKDDMWENISVSRKCAVDWNSMQGDEQVRFCNKCSQNVYNISQMTQEQAEEIIRKKNGDMCIRLYRRPDGMIMTKDCPRPAGGLTPLLIAGGIVGAAVIATYVAMTAATTQAVQGKMQVRCSPEKQWIVVATKPIRAGEKIAPDAIKEQGVPTELVPRGAIHSYHAVVGKVSKSNVNPGTAVTEVEGF